MEQRNASPGLGAVLSQFIEADRRKWGGMTLGAHARLGLAELRDAVSLKSGNEAVTPLGIWATMTPGEVGATRQEPGQESSPFGNPGEEPAQPSPGDIAYGRDAGSIYGQSAVPSQEMQADGPPSPSEIAKGPSRPDAPTREFSQEHGRER